MNLRSVKRDTWVSILFTAVVAMTGPCAFALNGGANGGGGNADARGEVFDFAENEGTEVLHPFDDQRVSPALNPIFANLAELSPDATEFLRDVKKKWLLDPKPFSDDRCLNSSMVRVAGQRIVACQDKTEIRINATWWADPLKGDPRAQRMTPREKEREREARRAKLIVHELLVDKGMSVYGYGDAPELKYDVEKAIRELNRRIFSGDLGSGDDFIKLVHDTFPRLAYSSYSGSGRFMRQFHDKASYLKLAEDRKKYSELYTRMTNEEIGCFKDFKGVSQRNDLQGLIRDMGEASAHASAAHSLRNELQALADNSELGGVINDDLAILGLDRRALCRNTLTNFGLRIRELRETPPGWSNSDSNTDTVRDAR